MAACAALALGTATVVLLGESGASVAAPPRPQAGPARAADGVDAATITIEAAGVNHFQFTPSTVNLNPGGTLTVVNETASNHTFTSVAIGPNGDQLFNVAIPAGTPTTPTSRTIPVSTLGDGTYDFYCQVHPEMTGTLIVGTGGPVPSNVPKFEQPLVQPRRLTGSNLTIVMRKADVRVLPHGPRTPMWTFGGSFPGPTIVRRTGHDTKVTFVNRLPRAVGAVTIHQHGGHQQSRFDGQPMSFLIKHGKKRTYDFPLTDGGRPLPAALRFYHDHKMSRTARDNWFGLQGMFLTTDPKDAKRGLPHGRYDVPLMVTDRSFTKTNRLVDPFRHPASAPSPMPAMSGMPAGLKASDPGTATVGSKVLVNGRFAPYLRVRPGLYRLQILNASLFSSYDFALSDGRPFVQIGTGSGLLPHPVTRQDIFLGPAQRADVVVDFRKETTRQVLLLSIPRTGAPPMGNGSRDAALMQFRIGTTPAPAAHVPYELAHIRSLKVPRKIAMTWTFGVSKDQHGSYWSINGKRFDPRRIDHRVVLGTTEKWRLRNTTDMTHFVHLHEELWRTISRDGKRPPPWERGYEDTWKLDPGETVVVAAKFTDFTGPFMIHCHMLDHEDDGMMATWDVVRRR